MFLKKTNTTFYIFPEKEEDGKGKIFSVNMKVVIGEHYADLMRLRKEYA